MTSPRKTNPTAAELAEAQAVADLLGGGTAHPTEDGGLILDPISDDRSPTEDELLADENAAYAEHGERAAEKGWRLTIGRRHRAPLDGEGWAAAVPAGTPVLIHGGILGWTTGMVDGYHFVVRVGTTLGPLMHVTSVRPCTEDNLPTRYAAALAVQLTDALDQIATNDDDDDVALRAIRMKRAAADIADGIITGTY